LICVYKFPVINTTHNGRGNAAKDASAWRFGRY
jgi:hypothetical protein